MIKTNKAIDYGKALKTLNQKDMKVIIKRVIETNANPYFQVVKDGFSVGVFSYLPNEPEGSIYNEAVNLAKAKALAEKLETGATRVEEIIYETPDDPNDLPDGLFQALNLPE